MHRHSSNAEPVPATSRRGFLKQSSMGLGSLALMSMLHEETTRGQDPQPTHFAPKVRSAIWLFMTGGVSHVDTFDYKPELQRRHGQRLAGADPKTGFFSTSGRCLRSPFQFRQHGRSGAWVSEIFPCIANHVDDLAFLHSCYSSQNNHVPACLELMTGMNRPGYPCLGSWLTYGLGSLNKNLPSFVVMYETKPRGDDSIWSPGFLPKNHQPLTLDARRREEIANLTRSTRMNDAQQRSQLDLLRQFNQEHQERRGLEADLAARIHSFELAYRMQTAAPEALDFSQEPQHVHKMYGLNGEHTATFGRQCLLARRLVERGVRFVQIFFGCSRVPNALLDAPWDAHDDIQSNHRMCAEGMDQPVAALLADLKSRGLLESTLVIWGSEFGRTSDSQGSTGRDHNPHANTIWMAGGGIRGGIHYGATDDFGYKAIENRVSVNDISATILHLFGFDHTRLTYRFNGRYFRLTDIGGNVVREILS
jgi:Protein of unknown function (DUF1501)